MAFLVSALRTVEALLPMAIQQELVCRIHVISSPVVAFQSSLETVAVWKIIHLEYSHNSKHQLQVRNVPLLIVIQAGDTIM